MPMLKKKLTQYFFLSFANKNVSQTILKPTHLLYKMYGNKMMDKTDGVELINEHFY